MSWELFSCARGEQGSARRRNKIQYTIVLEILIQVPCSENQSQFLRLSDRPHFMDTDARTGKSRMVVCRHLYMLQAQRDHRRLPFTQNPTFWSRRDVFP